VIRSLTVTVAARLGLTGRLFALREHALQLDPRVIRRNRRFRSGTGPDGLPLPSARLITLVAGTPDIEWFLSYGEITTNAVRAMLSRNEINVDQVDSMLDFGCGCGRMLRHWNDLPGTEIFGTDYHPDLVSWCRENLSFARVDLNGLTPPLGYRDNQFGLIYAFSVFTHLTSELQFAWIHELRRVLRPGGCLLITTHGDSYFHLLTVSERARFKSGGLVVRHGGEAGSNLCSAFHPETYLRARLLADFEVLEFESVSAGATDGVLQDMTLARKPFDDEPDDVLR
jgi:SAM-dependent methyltransferase